ncbi:MAG: MFS transporter [Gammaproteobacteria bacterium]|nr:MFS transporter [Gammaproteobacteria bacterium]MCH9744340.1 MFS transporter [Gammaproteobacteria bacterium]
MNRRAFILAVAGVCFGVAIGGLIFSELNLAIASMQRTLGASLHGMQWLINIYGIIVCSTLVIFGRLGDMFGRKRLYVIGLVILAAAMAGMGLSQNIGQAIFFQAVDGISSAIVMPISQALVTNIFKDDKKSLALGLWSACIGIALAIGPLYSGFVIHAWGWRWVFYLNVPIILLSIVLVALYCPESKSNEKEIRVDGWGSLSLALSVATIVMALVQFEIWPLWVTVMLVVISSICFITLLRVERRAKQPIIRKDLFGNRAFVLSSSSNALLIGFIWCGLFLIPLYLQNVFGLSAFHSGIVISIVTTPVILFSFANHRLYHFFGCKRLIRVGFVSLMVSAFLLYCFSKDMSLIVVVCAALTFGIGWGLIWSPSATKAISTLPQQHAGIASGTFVTFQEVGGTLGLAMTLAVVRLNPVFSQGFKHGALVLLFASAFGFCLTLVMKQTVRL